MKKNKIGSLAYALFLLVYVVAALTVGFFLLTKLWNYAEEYELSRPEKALDAYVETLNDDLWNEGLAETVTAMPHEFQSDEEVSEIIRNQFSGVISYARTSGGDKHTRRYSIRCGDKEIGKIQLAEDRSRETSYGLYPWTVVGEEYDFTNLYSTVSVTVPSTYTVTLNGQAMGEEYIVQDNIHYALLEEYYEDFPNLPLLVTYSFDHAVGTLTPAIYDEAGNLVEIDESRGDEQFLANCTEKEVERVTDFTNRFAERYARYTSGMGDDAAAAYKKWLSGYLVADSELARRMIAAQDGLYWARAYSVEILSMEINNIIGFGEGIYLCDYTNEVKVVRSEVDINQNNVKILILDNNGDMRVLEYNQY